VNDEKELAGQVVLITGGGRGIGRAIALELESAGAEVAVAARSREQVEDVATDVAGLAIEADVADEHEVERMVEETERELGPIDLLVANAGAPNGPDPLWEADVDEWWHVFEVNVRGVFLSCRAVLPGMIERGHGRIVITGSGAAYLPGSRSTGYSASKAAVYRLGETLSQWTREHGVHVFVISPGLVQTAMTTQFPDDAPWTPPELAPRLVRALASGRADALEGRYIHAEHDDIDDLVARADEIVDKDLNAIRLQR
jgi:3-oxoacyl-[acyl-carrier protein] reductase